MRIKGILTYLLLSVSAFGALAQEYDDMYFNGKDRAKLRAQKANDELVASAKKAKEDKEARAEEEEALNPTDSYSARNVNPEFAARSNAKTAKTDNEDYFVNDYQYTTTSNLNNWNNNFNNWYGNPWYSSNYYGSSINSWNSPYYGYYDPYYSPWYDPYWNYNGWSTSFSYHWGSNWNYGWGGNYSYWNRPYCGWSSSWGPSWYGNPYSYYGYGYPNVVVVNNYGEGRQVTYGKRNSRSSESNYGRNQQNASTVGRTTFTPSPNGSGSRSTNGRVAGTNSRSSNSNDEYYNRTWRRVTQEPASTSDNGSNSGGRSSTGNAPNNSNYGRSSSNGDSPWNRSSESRSSYTPSHSSYDGGGGSRSSGGSSGGGGSSGSRSSGSHSRSRGN